MRVHELVLPSGAHCAVAEPAQALSGELRPLVLCLHFGGPVSPWYGRGLLEQLVAPALAATGAVMVAPDYASNAWADAPCAACALEAIELAVADFQADVTRVLLTGYSKGGIGTWTLGAHYAERFSATVVMAG